MTNPAPLMSADSPEVLARFNDTLPLADAITRRMNRPRDGHNDFEELLNAARVGLLAAARRYDPSMGVPFAAFASFRVRGAVMDEIRRLAPHSRKHHARLVAAARAAELTEADLAWKHDSSPKSPSSAEEALDASLAALALSAAVSLESLDERNEPFDPFDLEAAVERSDLVRQVCLELDSFEPHEAEVMKQHYFFDRDLTEIARALGLTVSWVSRLHSKAISRLAERFAARASSAT